MLTQGPGHTTQRLCWARVGDVEGAGEVGLSSLNALVEVVRFVLWIDLTRNARTRMQGGGRYLDSCTQ